MQSPGPAEAAERSTPIATTRQPSALLPSRLGNGTAPHMTPAVSLHTQHDWMR